MHFFQSRIFGRADDAETKSPHISVIPDGLGILWVGILPALCGWKGGHLSEDPRDRNPSGLRGFGLLKFGCGRLDFFFVGRACAGRMS